MTDHSPTANAVSAAITTAVHGALQEAGGGMLTGFLCWAEWIDSEGEPSWCLAVGDDQRQSVSMGIATALHETVLEQLRAHLRDDDQ